MFQNRTEAGRVLAGVLKEYRLDSPLVLAIPRGGVVVGREVALAIGADLDVVMAKKIGAPYNPEFAIAAAGPDGKVVFSSDHHGGTPRAYVLEQAAHVREAVMSSLQTLEDNRPEKPMADRSVLVVDDGLYYSPWQPSIRATAEPRHLFLAVPVAPEDTIESLKPLVDDVICPLRPRFLLGRRVVRFV